MINIYFFRFLVTISALLCSSDLLLASGSSVIDSLKQATEGGSSWWIIIMLSFLAGVLTSFTPCVYPMIPITVGVLQAQGSRTFMHNFLSALSYVFGIALVYACLGYFSATASVLFGQWAGNPLVVGLAIMVFLYLAGSMFGWYELYTPAWLTSRSNIQAQGSLMRIFLFGVISGTVASPCVTPALAIVLSMAAKTAQPILGFFALFFFAVGMSILLVLIGTFSGLLSLLPRSGIWMIEVKKMLGFLLLAVCIYFARPVVLTYGGDKAYFIIRVLYGALFSAVAVYSLVRILGLRSNKA